MASFLSFSSITPNLNYHRYGIFFSSNYNGKINRIRCNGQSPTNNSTARRASEPENALLKVAWYGSELLGIAASYFRSPSSTEAPQKDLMLEKDASGTIDRGIVVETIKDDFQRSYFVTGFYWKVPFQFH